MNNTDVTKLAREALELHKLTSGGPWEVADGSPKMLDVGGDSIVCPAQGIVYPEKMTKRILLQLNQYFATEADAHFITRSHEEFVIALAQAVLDLTDERNRLQLALELALADKVTEEENENDG